MTNITKSKEGDQQFPVSSGTHSKSQWQQQLSAEQRSAGSDSVSPVGGVETQVYFHLRADLKNVALS